MPSEESQEMGGDVSAVACYPDKTFVKAFEGFRLFCNSLNQPHLKYVCVFLAIL